MQLNNMIELENISSGCKRTVTTIPTITIQARVKSGKTHLYRYRGRLHCAVSVLVIADTIPIDLLAAERMGICKTKSAGNHISGLFKENTISKWQRRWNEEDRGRWTKTLMPDIRPWISWKFGEVYYYFTQMLPDHG